MKKSSLLAAVLLAGTVGLTACGMKSDDKAFTPAQMADVFIKQMNKTNPDQPIAADARQKMEESLATQAAMAEAAIKEGFDKTDDAEIMLKVQQQTTLAKLYMDAKLEAYKPTDAELQKLFDTKVATMPEDQKKIMMGDFYHLRHILVKTEAEAAAIIAKLKAGEKFETLAQVSLDGSKEKGGDLGWSPLAGYVPEFSKAASALKAKEVTQKPVKTQFGFHVIEAMEDPKPAVQALKSQLTEMAKQDYVKTLEDSFKAKKEAPAAKPEEKK